MLYNNEFYKSLECYAYINRKSPTQELLWMDGEYELFLKAVSENIIPEKYLDYEKNPIRYNYNHMGYRSEYQYPTPEDFGYAIGCSNVFGSSLHIEDRYDSIITKKIGRPIINIGLPGASYNYVKEQVFYILSSNFKLPKFMIIEWPPITRYTFFGDKGPIIINAHLSKHNNDYRLFEEIVSFDTKNNIFESEYMIARKSVKNILHKFNIQYFEWTLLSGQVLDDDIKLIEYEDYARDGIHPGPKTNKRIAEKFLNFII